MRRVGIVFVAIAVACGKFGGDAEPATTPLDGGTDAEARTGETPHPEAGADAPAATCASVHPPQCNGVVTHVDLTNAPVTEANTTHAYATTSDPCGELTVKCVAPAIPGPFSAYYSRTLDSVPLHFFLHQQIRGPVTTASVGDIPLTFGCGLFLTTSTGDVAQARFEISKTIYEIDSEDTAGHDPPGVGFKAAGDPMPDTATPRSFDLEVTIVEPVPPSNTGTINATAAIDGKVHAMNEQPFEGSAQKAVLECGLLQADAKQAELCDLSIRQIELEICPP